MHVSLQDMTGSDGAQETLRMFPPVAIGQARLVSADLRLSGNFCLPAGVAALVPHHAMHSVSFNWDKPNELLPGIPLSRRVCHCLLVVPS